MATGSPALEELNRMKSLSSLEASDPLQYFQWHSDDSVITDACLRQLPVCELTMRVDSGSTPRPLTPFAARKEIGHATRPPIRVFTALLFAVNTVFNETRRRRGIRSRITQSR